jgi:hypothetical protein
LSERISIPALRLAEGAREATVTSAELLALIDVAEAARSFRKAALTERAERLDAALARLDFGGKP